MPLSIESVSVAMKYDKSYCEASIFRLIDKINNLIKRKDLTD
jgi:hypothetical protein